MSTIICALGQEYTTHTTMKGATIQEYSYNYLQLYALWDNYLLLCAFWDNSKSKLALM